MLRRLAKVRILRGVVEHARVGCVARCTLNGVTIHELVRSRTISLTLSEIRNNRYESDSCRRGHPKRPPFCTGRYLRIGTTEAVGRSLQSGDRAGSS